MSTPSRWKWAGDRAFLIALEASDLEAGSAAALSLYRHLRRVDAPELEDLVPGARTVLVLLKPGAVPGPGLIAAIEQLELPRSAHGDAAPPGEPLPERVVELAVSYGGGDGVDLEEVARLAGLSVDEAVALHSEALYRVAFIGFAPGFAYLTGLPERLHTPRLATPRPSVPAGSVAIGGPLTGVYPRATPGGWRLIGRTDAALFDVQRDPPSLLRPGDRVRFVPAGAYDAEGAFAAGASTDAAPDRGAAAPPPDSRPLPRRASDRWTARRFGNRVTAGASDHPVHPGSRRRARLGRDTTAASPCPSDVTVVRPGLLTLVQDLGRPALGHLGVPSSGAFDPPALIRANRRVGNPDQAAGLEITLHGPELLFAVDTVIAVSGARIDARLETHDIPHDTPVRVRAGQRLTLGRTLDGARTWLAVRDGFDTPPVLGSRSTLLSAGWGGLEGRALRAGDRLTLGDPGTDASRIDAAPPRDGTLEQGGIAGRTIEADGTAGDTIAVVGIADATIEVDGTVGGPLEHIVRVIPGPQEEAFDPAGLATFYGTAWVVSSRSDRMGVRLEGPAITRLAPADILPEGIAPGSIQVPGDGRPIVLGPDRPATGGYTKIATVISADLERIARARPGDRLRFRPVDLEEAREAWRRVISALPPPPPSVML